MIVENIAGEQAYLTGIRGEITRKRAVNGEHTISFEVVNTDENTGAFELLEGRGSIHLLGESYRILPFDTVTVGNRVIKRIDAVHTFYDLNGNYVYGTLTGAIRMDAACQHIFKDTGYTVMISGSWSSVTFENFGDDNTISLLQTIMSRYGAEYEVIGKNVYIRNRIGSVTDTQFRYRYNIKTISMSEDWSDFCTYIEGFGKDELHSTYTSPLASKYGIIHQKPVRDERYTIQSELDARIQRELNDMPKLSIKLDASQAKEILSNKLGDYCWCIHEPLELDIQVRILSITDYPSSPKTPVYEFASVPALNVFSAGDVSYAPNTQQTTSSLIYGSKATLGKVITTDGKVSNSALENNVQQVVGGVGSAFTQLDFDDKYGIVARDPGNFMRWVCFKKSGVYATEDNGFTLKEIINPTGLVTGNLDLATLTYVNSELANKANVTHNHDDIYALIEHNHDIQYSEKNHNHDQVYVKNESVTLVSPNGTKHKIVVNDDSTISAIPVEE